MESGGVGILDKQIKNNNMNCIIIHGCPSDKEKAMNPETRTYDKHWIPWIKEKLIENGIKTETPLMPTPWEPVYEKFKREFEKYEVDENTILIGHSCGCSFLVRWLGDTKRKISKLILVAPWKIYEAASDFEKAFYVFPIDENIKSRVDKIVMFTADDEDEDGKKGLKMFHEYLGGQIVDLEGRGHYTMDDMGTTEFPELLDVILK
jgi:predicted alpha/beta hydrolase family esterase